MMSGLLLYYYDHDLEFKKAIKVDAKVTYSVGMESPDGKCYCHCSIICCCLIRHKQKR